MEVFQSPSIQQTHQLIKQLLKSTKIKFQTAIGMLL
jgi:hypothetical protein